MKKWQKITLIVVGSLIGLFALTQALISPIAKNYINKHGHELVGRQVSVDKLWINLMNASISADGIRMMEVGGDSVFVSCAHFQTKMRIFPLLKEKFIISRIYLDSLYASVLQNGDAFNYDDLIARFAGEEDPADTLPSKWDIGIYNISLRDAMVHYRDQQIGGVWNMDNITVDIPGVYFSSENTDVGLKLDFPDGGSLASNIEYDYQDGTYDLSLSLRDFTVGGLLPYFRQYMNISSLDGLLSGDVRIAGETEHVFNFDVSGTAWLKRFNMLDDNGREVFSIDSTYTAIKDVNLEKSEYLLGDLEIYGMKTHFELYADSTHCFSALMKDIPEDPNEPEMMMGIDHFLMADAVMQITDHTTHTPFHYTISQLRMEADNISTTSHCSMSASALLGESGRAMVKWAGNPVDASNHDITIELHNVDMTHFSPYMVTMFGHPFTHGTLTYRGQNVIRNNQLQGTNHIDIHNPKLDKKIKEVKSQYNVPIRTGFYILTDHAGRMKMDLPVSGNIDSPEFSYKKIIINALVGTMAKVVTSPVRFMAGAMGLSHDGIEYIEVDPLQADFTSEQYDKIGKLAEMSLKKPELLLTLSHGYNLDQAIEKESLAELKRNFYLKNNPALAAAPMDMLTQEKALALDNRSTTLLAYADSLLTVSGQSVTGDITAKAKAIHAPKAEQNLSERTATRNTILHTHMTTKLGVAPSSLTVRAIAPDSLRTHKDRNGYHVGMSLPGDDVKTDALPEEE